MMLDLELSREELVLKAKEIYDLACGEDDEDSDSAEHGSRVSFCRIVLLYSYYHIVSGEIRI
jgi:hypothetical protein